MKRTVISAMLLVAASIGSIAPAFAGPADYSTPRAEQRAIGRADLAPDCMEALTFGEYEVRVTNYCKTSKRVRVALDWNTDFRCETIRKGTTKVYRWSWGTFDRLESC